MKWQAGVSMAFFVLAFIASYGGNVDSAFRLHVVGMMWLVVYLMDRSPERR